MRRGSRGGVHRMAFGDRRGPLGGCGRRAFDWCSYNRYARLRMIGMHWDTAVSVAGFGRRRRGLLGVRRDGGRRVTVGR